MGTVQDISTHEPGIRLGEVSPIIDNNLQSENRIHRQRRMIMLHGNRYTTDKRMLTIAIRKRQDMPCILHPASCFNPQSEICNLKSAI